MIKHSAGTRYSNILPTTFEGVALLFLTLFTIFIGNTKQLLDYYGLSETNQLLKQGATHAVATSLGKIDSFSFTDSVVTFIVWALVGVICFGAAQAIGNAYHEFRREELVSSNRYIHPKTFRRSAFWWGVFVDLVTGIIGAALVIGALFVLLVYVLPIGLSYARAYLTTFSYGRLGDFALGFFMLYGWLFVLTVTLKLALNRHRLRVR